MIERELPLESERGVKPDVIIVHGSGLHELGVGRKDWSPGFGRLPKSSWDARMRLTAAGELWRRFKKVGRELPIIVAGGNVYPTLAPSIADTMKEDLMRRFRIPEEKIVMADGGGNTVTDNEEVIRIMKVRGFHTGIDISSGYHKVEEFLAHRRGTDFVPAEEILKGRHKRYLKIVEDLERSLPVRRLYRDQKLRVLVLRLPFVGKSLYTRHSRHLWHEIKSGAGAQVTIFDPYGLRKMTGKL